ncbi:3'-5' exonuclease [Psychrilyobacter atlanticus]|uniref:3'-5' exonuclease n=1 Tax=Psychrilyobacter atlanticus TaxID=271091 RepID=UPI0004181D19|nr:3'-5' exonuclease [Psychrilyobacter atlanticus]
MKILWYDTETTGLTENSAMFQISGVIEVDGELKEEFDIFCHPHEGADISEQALEVTGMSREELDGFQSPKKAYEELVEIFSKYIDKFDREDKFIIAGQNVKFDIDVLNRFFKRNNDNYLGSFLNYKQVFDTLSVYTALEIADVVPKLENHKLETICKIMGVELSNAHNSLADIKATKEVGDKLLQGLRRIKKQKIKL